MKYIIEEYVLNEYNASSKARKDVSYFVLQNGFLSLGKNDKTQIRHNKMAKALLAFKLFVKIVSLKKEDVLFLQTSELLLKIILKFKNLRGFKVIYLIHDLFCLAYNESETIALHQKEINRNMALMSQCNCVIAHNSRMIDKMKKLGCSAQLVSLDIFDYNTTILTPQRYLINGERIKIAFAGNINKSKFLEELDVPHIYDLIVYGGPSKQFQTIDYKGCVDPDILPQVIEGHFGLIWEGNYKAMKDNNYNLLNNPHKLSMYIVAGLPIIAWKDSYAAKFIEQYNIGFGVNSLDEITPKLTTISIDVYNEYVSNCHNLAVQLKQGMYIAKALKKAYEVINANKQ